MNFNKHLHCKNVLAGMGQAFSVATAISKFPPSALNTDRAALYLACLSEKHIQAGLVANHRETHLSTSIKVRPSFTSLDVQYIRCCRNNSLIEQAWAWTE